MKNVIEIKNVNFHYKGAGYESLKDVSLSIKEGETLLLCGSSGSGKTSVIRLINGLIPHYYQGELSGEVSVAGRNISITELYELAGSVGTVFQNPRSQFFSVDTDGEIVFGPENIGLEPTEILKRKDAVVEDMGIEKLLGKSLFSLSGGEKQQIACASVAALLPGIILLDEPSSNLDRDAIEKLRNIILQWKEEGKTIIISEHRLWYLRELFDRVVYMDGGKIRKQWSREDFLQLSAKGIEDLKLRPLDVPSYFSVLFNEKNSIDSTTLKASEGAICLKDFYFSYNHRPYIFRKKKFTEADGENLELKISILKLPRGKVIGVVGKNGTGKSTFLRCVCGLEKDCGGTIEIDGQVYKGNSRIGLSYMVMQDVNHQLFTDSVKAEVLLSMKDKDEKRCREILEELGLFTYKDTHPMALSGGQKQRVAIASAIAAGAQLFLFDEPTSGLDYDHMMKVGRLLKKLADSGKTVLVSTHDPELIEQCCDYELYIEHGRVLSLGEIEDRTVKRGEKITICVNT